MRRNVDAGATPPCFSVLIIETVYGTHSYRIADIKGVFSSDGKGERKDITKLITEQNQEDYQW